MKEIAGETVTWGILCDVAKNSSHEAKLFLKYFAEIYRRARVKDFCFIIKTTFLRTMFKQKKTYRFYIILSIGAT